MKKSILKLIIIFLVTLNYSQLSAQEIKTKQDALNYFNNELLSRHSVSGWPQSDSDWFVSLISKDDNGKEYTSFYDINGFGIENEFLILKIRQENFVTQNGRTSKVYGNIKELLINLNDSLIINKKVLSGNSYMASIAYKNYEVAHRGDEWIHDSRYPDKPNMVRKNPIYKKNKNYDADKVAELYNAISVLKANLDTAENANHKMDELNREKLVNNQVSSINEEQRKHIVQANAANDSKDYKSALSLYRKVLEVNKFSYPDAYFNMALILAQTENYYQAIQSMKAYLILNANAEDARKAQDKIYEWELNIIF